MIGMTQMDRQTEKNSRPVRASPVAWAKKRAPQQIRTRLGQRTRTTEETLHFG